MEWFEKLKKTITDALPDAIAGMFKRHLESAYSALASSSVGKKIAGTLKKMGPAGRTATEAFLNIFSAAAANKIDTSTPVGRIAEELVKDAVPELLARMLNGLEQTANTTSERSFTSMFSALMHKDRRAALGLAQWLAQLPDEQKAVAIATLSRLSSDEVAAFMAYKSGERDSIFKLWELEKELADKRSPLKAFSQTLGVAFDEAAAAGKTLAAKSLAALAWYFRWLTYLTGTALAIALLYALLLWLTDAPVQLLALAPGLYWMLLVAVGLFSFPLLVLTIRIYRKSTDVRMAIVVFREGFLAAVLATSAILLFAPVSLRFTFIFLAAGAAVASFLWIKGYSIVDFSNRWATRFLYGAFTILVIGRLFYLTLNMFPDSTGMVGQIQQRVNRAVETIVDRITDEDQILITPEELVTRENNFGLNDEALIRYSEINRGNGTVQRRFFVGKYHLRDRRYNAPTHPLTQQILIEEEEKLAAKTEEEKRRKQTEDEVKQEAEQARIKKEQEEVIRVASLSATPEPTTPPTPDAILPTPEPTPAPVPTPTPDPVAIVPVGTAISTDMVVILSAKDNKPGDRVAFRIDQPVLAETGEHLLKAGTTARGTLLEVSTEKHFLFVLRLDEVLTAQDEWLPIQTQPVSFQFKKPRFLDRALKVAIPVAVGIVGGKKIGGDKGAVIGGAAGAATAVILLSRDGKDIQLQAGTKVAFVLTESVALKITPEDKHLASQETVTAARIPRWKRRH